MADFRKLYYAIATVGLFVGLSASASAQSLSCTSITATNQIIRTEGDAELVGDIVLACSQPVGSSFTTPPGTLVAGADITVSIPSTIITSKIINPGASTAISEATLIIDDLKDQTTNAYPGSRPHRICADTTNPGGLGVCQVLAQASGPQNTYDGTPGHPNIFVGQPNGTGALIFRGVPLDPPGTNFTRYIRFTNIRVNAAATGLTPGNPLSQITAIISFQGPASVQQTLIQTTVATIQTGNGLTTVPSADSSFLQCEYPLYTFSGTADAAVTQDCGGVGTSSPGGGTSSGTTTSATLQAFCTESLTSGNAGLWFNSSLKFAAAQFKEGFQSAWKARNMSLYLGQDGQVLSDGTTGACAAVAAGSPCDYATAGHNGPNNVSSTQYFTYNGSSNPFTTTPDIAQNNPQIRYFTEGGFTESINGNLSPRASYEISTGAGFHYEGSPWSTLQPGAGVADQGTRLQSTITNIPANVVVALPTVVWLWNGGINSGVAVLVSTTANGGGAINPYVNGARNGSSALPSVQTGVVANNSSTPGTNCIGTGVTGGGPTKDVACNGYVDVSGPTATFTYEIIFSDPFSVEAMDVIPVVYYPAGELTAKPQVLPQTNIWAQIAPYTFAPWIAQPGGNQITNPLGQKDGTPRFLQTTGTAINWFYINNCTCSLLFPWVVSDNDYVTGIVVANTSADPTNALSIPGYTAVQENGTVKLYLFGTIGGKSAQTKSDIAATYGGVGDTQALAGSYAAFIVSTGFDGYAITQANFQYCHGLAFLYNATGAVPPVSYLGLVMDPAGLTRTTQTVGDPLGN